MKKQYKILNKYLVLHGILCALCGVFIFLHKTGMPWLSDWYDEGGWFLVAVLMISFPMHIGAGWSAKINKGIPISALSRKMGRVLNLYWFPCCRIWIMHYYS